MTKTMRKYQKWILAVFGTLLMVSWLFMGTQGQGCGDPGNSKYATIDGEKVTVRDITTAEAEYKMLDDLLPATMRVVLNVRDARHWLLLTHEADKAGLEGEAADGESSIPAIVELEMAIKGQILQSQANSQEGIQRFFSFLGSKDREAEVLKQRLENSALPGAMSKARSNPREDFQRMLARMMGVQRMIESAAAAPRFSDARTRLASRQFLDAAIVDAVVLDARAAAALSAAPTPEQLTAFFDAHKALKPQDSPNGVGYWQPNRIKMEWMVFRADLVRGSIAIDEVELNKRYLANRAKYTGELALERARIEGEMREETFQRVMIEVERAATGIVRAAIKRLDDEGPFKKLPADWASTRPSLDVIAQQTIDAVREATGVTLPKPQVNPAGEKWLRPQDAMKIPGLKDASARVATREVSALALMFNVRELAEGPAAAELGLQKLVTLNKFPITDAEGSRYFVTVIDTLPESAATRIEEAQPEIEQDWKAAQIFQKFSNDAQAIRDLAVKDGLPAVANLGVVPTDPNSKPAPVQTRLEIKAKDPNDAPGRGVMSDAVRSAVLQAAASLDPLKLPDASTLATRTVVVPLEKELKVVVAQVLQVRPATQEALRQQSQRLAQQLAANEARKLGQEGSDGITAYTPKSLVQRLAFKPVRGEAIVEEPTPEAPKTPSK